MRSWDRLENGQRVPKSQGEQLVITEDMIGYNHFQCWAENDVKGQPKTASRDIKFNVGK